MHAVLMIITALEADGRAQATPHTGTTADMPQLGIAAARYMIAHHE